MLRNSVKRVPLWAYGVIAVLLATLTIALWAHIDAFSRAELLVPAAVWTAAFIVIGLRRRSARS